MKNFSMKSNAMTMKSLSVLLVFLLAKCSISQDLFPLSIIHVNDMHARFEETNWLSNTCKEGDECIGGYARVVAKVKELKGNSPNPIYLNVGDNFQGTFWYNHFRWNASQHFLNLLPADVMVNRTKYF